MDGVSTGIGLAGMASVITGPGPIVLAGRVPAIRASAVRAKMAGTRPAMTLKSCDEIIASIDAPSVETVMAGG
ncbi:MAG TPA: hypothetical protein DDZ81_18580, partial [Acetobacteraceae bacterium]|nr:hypothetical protein [Acetobacteraceae bacterium]